MGFHEFVLRSEETCLPDVSSGTDGAFFGEG